MLKVSLSIVLFSVFMGRCSSKGEATENVYTLIAGREAPAGQFPASVYVAMTSGGKCSATVVGSKTLLIASHCVADSLTLTFSVLANNYSAVCTRSRVTGHDLALCKIDKEVKGVSFENVNLDANLVRVGSEVLLTGYGCTQSNGGRGAGGNDGIYRIGEAFVTRLPEEFDYETNSGAALCFGDSGGSAYFYLDAEKTRRVVISTNSRGDISALSLITSTSTKASVDFMTAWSKDNVEKICGLHPDAKGCLGASSGKINCETAYERLGLCLIKDAVQY